MTWKAEAITPPDVGLLWEAFDSETEQDLPVQIGATMLGFSMFDALGSGLGVTLQDGRRARVSSNVNGNGGFARKFAWPCWSMTGANPHPPQAQLVRRYRYVWNFFAYGKAGVDGEIGIRNAANPLKAANTQVGWSLDPTGGTWGMNRRLVVGGGLTNPPLLYAPSATVPRPIRFEFTEGDDPLFEVYIDSILAFSTHGWANMPQIPAATFATAMYPAVGNYSGTQPVVSFRNHFQLWAL